MRKSLHFDLAVTAAIFCSGSLSGAFAASLEKVTVVRQAKTETSGGLYPPNRAPLQPAMLLRLPIGSVTPQGWLACQLQLETKGFTGRLEEISRWLQDKNNGWIDSAKKGGWEEFTYWFKGYIDLGYVAGDEKIEAHARELVEKILSTQRENGYFGPENLLTSLRNGRSDSNGKPDTWPHSPLIRGLRSYYEATGDPRIIPFITRYFKWMATLPPKGIGGGWGYFRFGDYIETVQWLYNLTGDKFLLDLARVMHENSANYTHNIPTWHNVNFAQGFREPMEYWVFSGDPKHFEGTVWTYQRMMQMYGQFSGGGFAGDEGARPGYNDARQSMEMCGFVEYMASHEILTRIAGDPEWADRCEEVAFNSLPAAYTSDLKAMRYLTSANVAVANRESHRPSVANNGAMFPMSPFEDNRCCLHNSGQGWPYYAEESWLATADNGLCVSLYVASAVSAKVGDGTTIKMAERTDYPFGDTISLTLSTPKALAFPLWLRIPGWCDAPELKVNRRTVKATTQAPCYVRLERTWADGDTITLRLPMQLKVRTWTTNKSAVSVDYGPLTFSLKIGEDWRKYSRPEWDRFGDQVNDWPSYEIFPTTPWNYGLEIDAKNPARSIQVVKKQGPLAGQPWTPENAPIELLAKARRIPAWKLDASQTVSPMKNSPAYTTEKLETVKLVPMGCQRLRISTFPAVTSAKAKGNDWAGEAQDTFQASTSFRNNESPRNLHDGMTPESSRDESVPRMTWWDHRSSTEWAQYDYLKPVTAAAVEVYWFDESPRNNCRVPESWRLLYKDGDQWKPVEGASVYGTAPDKYNRVTFKPVATTGLRVEAKLKEGWSAGILEWRVETK